MPDPNERVAGDSDRYLEIVRRIGELELEKRTEADGTPRFHELGEQIARLTQDAFHVAVAEEDDGDQTQRTGETINDVASRDSPEGR
jgi:hypothetical protein